jgi:hypothetical protein
VKSIRHFLPRLPGWLKEVQDPRPRQDTCRYPIDHIVLLALLMLCVQSGSRRQMDRDRLRDEFLANFKALLGTARSST